MEVIRNDAKIKKYRQISQGASLLGLLILSVGLVLAFTGNEAAIFYQWIVLIVGILMWQVALNFSYKYVQRPRPDEVLDAALKGAAYKGYFYHHYLPANHVLLTRAGPVVMVPKVQSGKISVTGTEKGDKWRRQGSIFKRIMGREPALANPTQEANLEISKLVKYVNEHAPELDEIPIGAIVVFTQPDGKVMLEKNGPNIPVVHASELRKYIKKQIGRPLPPEQFRRLKAIFDEQVS
jgi:hypothetical protein